ncbi:hypothetical protein PSm6_00330 [Pseudomonas solani]|uniref:Uncharacterized protein n=1 Tax=Pseudomonas solani TaxID=2731552 RepID=A0ABN6BMU2_9PSED|nr:hypothetical protein [Pseudomonas solani]BCD83626.1 hypothetical protein PSm6_00330 [Pseudomonas solani]
MTDIDWSKAPEGATHWEPENHLVNAGWMKVDGNGDWFFWSSCRKTWTEHMIAPGAARMSRMIARATAEEERNAAIVEIGRLFHEGGPAAIYFAGYRKQEAV